VKRGFVIGAGPAGLTAAHELRRLGIHPTILEATAEIGGISQTAVYKGYRFDIGGHRFFTKMAAVQQFWEELLKEEFLLRPRLSRIYYDGKFFDYPLNPGNVLRGLGPIEAVRVGLSYLTAQLTRSGRPEHTFEEWVTSRFGRRLFDIFFKSYTEKVWGIPCSEIDSQWASQRLRDLDLSVILKNMLLGAGRRSNGELVATLIEQFHYPRYGPGQMWERCAERLATQGVDILRRQRVERIVHEGGRVRSVLARGSDGSETEFRADCFVSTMPVRELVHAFDPPLPKEMTRAADTLRYRDFLTVGLIIDQPDLFPDNWIYVHSDTVKVGRIQNFKNWSPDMVPDPATTSLGLEYFVQEMDDLWCAPDDELIDLGRRECAALGLIDPNDILDGTVIRMPKAYPVYDSEYRDAIALIREGLEGFSNLELIGRNGQHRYNNQDHSMMTGILAARNLAGEGSYNVWSPNLDSDYHEEMVSPVGRREDRLVPERVPEETLEDLIRSGFARYDPIALAGAMGLVSGMVLLIATAGLLIQETRSALPMLSLLGNYLLGYEVSWAGAWLGLLAHMLNFVIGLEQRRLDCRIESARAMDLIDGHG
jgi:protoporphyrinogen oxidase